MAPSSLATLVVAALLALAFVAQAAQPKPLTVETVHKMKRVSAHAVNSRGSIAWSERTWQRGASGPGTVTNNLRVLLSGTGAVANLTDKVGVSDSGATFSDDGNTVFFLSSRSGSSQVWYVSVTGGEQNVQQLTNLPIDIDNVRYFTKGGQPMLLLTMSVYTSCPANNLQCTASRDAATAARGPNTWMEFDSLMVRHWDVWEVPGKASHVFVIPLLSSSGKWKTVASGLKDLMPSMNVDAPVPPFGGLEQIDISPDGSEVAYTGVVIEAAEAWTTGWKIFTVNIDSGLTTCITNFPARASNPAYSPDGKWIAYLAMNVPGHESDKLHIERYDRSNPTAPAKTVTNYTDISFAGIIWDKNSQSVIADADYYGYHVLFSVNMYVNLATPYDDPSKFFKPMNAMQGSSESLVRQPGTNTFVYQYNSMMTPVDLYSTSYSFVASSGGGSISVPVQLTAENGDILSTVSLQTPERFSFTGALGERVYGWVLKPFGYTAGQTYPVAELVHGGPEGNWGDDWSYRWNPQLWTGHGYGVIMIDFHGSTGYGQNFTNSIQGNWGSYPYEDIITGTQYALQTYSWMDSSRIAACGASYGGYMINWLQGHTTIFSALVTHDGIFDTETAYYSTEELWFPEAEFMGTPWDNMALYQKWNPANFVSNWQTPHLIIHGQHDFRLELVHGLSAFTALQRKGIPSKLLYMTMESHWVLADENSIKWYHAVLDWLDKWTTPNHKQ